MTSKLIIFFLLVLLVPIVSAQDETIGCCQNFQGNCVPRAIEQDCLGDFYTDEACNVEACQFGCCQIFDQAIITTAKGCSVKSEFYSMATNFRSGINEAECLASTEDAEIGACTYMVNKEKKCTQTTEEKCEGSERDFFENILCSDKQLNTTCTPHNYTSCSANDDSVYWFDSCNNKEDVYLRCNIFEGSVCGKYRPSIDVAPEIGNYVCRNLDCIVEIDGINVTKKNTESWCKYEGRIDNGLDTVGSRHWLHFCDRGVEKIEPCADFRNEVCTQIDYKNDDDNSLSSTARCTNNDWRSCLVLNNEETITRKNKNLPETQKIDPMKECTKNPFCYIKKINVDDHYKFDMCMPRFPPGFDLKDERETEEAQNLCGIATQRCVAIYQRDRTRQWKCEVNCNCEEAIFTQQMNDLCIGLGDCGGYVNYVGDSSTEGYTISGAPNSINKTSFENYETFTGQSVNGTKMRDNSKTMSGDLDAGIFDSGSGTIMRLDKGLIPFVERDSIGTKIHKQELRDVGIGDIKKYKINFKCYPWQPIDGGNECSSCDTQSRPCSTYRCQSLGKNCEFINEQTGNEMCVDISPDDYASPQITFEKEFLTQDLNFEKQKNGVIIKHASNDKGCLQEFSELSFGLRFNEPSVCKIATVVDDKYYDFDNMTEYFGSRNIFLHNHSVTIDWVPRVEDLAYTYEVDHGAYKENYGTLKYYIRCKDYSGNANLAEYVVQACVKPGPDLMPPRIKYFEPENKPYLAYGINKLNVTFWVNEQAHCKWSHTPSLNYSLMENNVQCQTRYEDKDTGGWMCFPDFFVTENNTKAYIKCKDKPWLPESNETRYENKEDTVYEMLPTRIPLQTTQILPTNKKVITTGIEPTTVVLKASTSNGAEHGEARCFYRFTPSQTYKPFLETDNKYHTQEFNLIYRGDYSISVYCRDVAGNMVENITKFTVKVDNIGPSIIRVYYDNGLKVTTSEKGQCRYSFSKRFKWENATKMSSSGLTHIAPWRLQTYYIQCADDFGNRGNKIKTQAHEIV